jgi:hypothetical protein
MIKLSALHQLKPGSDQSSRTRGRRSRELPPEANLPAACGRLVIRAPHAAGIVEDDNTACLK